MLSPGKVTTTVGNGHNNITVSCETNYPFDHVLLYTIHAQRPFDFYVRVPEWYIAKSSYIAANDEDRQVLSPDLNTGMHKLAVGKGVTTIAYKLEARIRIEKRMNQAITVQHGALLYALEIGANISAMPPRSWEHQDTLPTDQVVPQTKDHTITNTTAWAVAIDPSTLKFHSRKNASLLVEALPNPIWQAGAPPTYMTAEACEIPWGCSKGVPANPPPPRERKCLGGQFQVKLIPYGTAKIHVAEFPTVSLSLGPGGQVADQRPLGIENSEL